MTGSRILAQDLAALGVRAGSHLLVHASLRQVGASADATLAALRSAVGPEGTLVVPTFTAGNSDTSPLYKRRTKGMTNLQLAAFHAAMPPFDPLTTPSEGMGQLAERVRCDAAAVRSVHPQTSFAGIGPGAKWSVRHHDVECHLGEQSPLARLYQACAQVLLLGVGYEVCSGFHLAEYRVDGAPWQQYRCVVRWNGERRWLSYSDVVLDDHDFGALGAAFETHDHARLSPSVRRGRVGGALARLFPLVEAVDFATGWLTENRPHAVSTDSSQNRDGFLH